MPEPDALRAAILTALRGHPGHVDAQWLPPGGHAECCADAVMAVLAETCAPRTFLDPPPELSAEQVAAWQTAWTEALDGDTTMRLSALTPNAVMIRRRGPEDRARYLAEHREQAIADGIPADLIDMMIADAEAGAP